MTVTVKTLLEAKQAENSQTTQYTAEAVRAAIDTFTATNTSASNATLSVNIVANSGSVSDANLIVDERAIAAGDTYTFPELVGHVLQPGDFISTIASAASALTIRVSGREIS